MLLLLLGPYPEVSREPVARRQPAVARIKRLVRFC
jgi:hypothetical protein